MAYVTVLGERKKKKVGIRSDLRAGKDGLLSPFSLHAPDCFYDFRMIEFHDVTHRFGTQEVFVKAHFKVHPGERIGVVGPNGAGKSTLFALITGEAPVQEGVVTTPKKIRLSHVRQQLFAKDNEDTLVSFTAAALPELVQIHAQIEELEKSLEHVCDGERGRALERMGTLQYEFEHAGGYEMQARAERALSALGFQESSFSLPFQEFSGGWQMRAELARALIGNPDVLLLDEPSNYLDLPAVEWLKRFLRDFPGTLLLISHDRYLLESLTTLTLEIDHQRVTRYAGPYSYYTEQREARFAQAVSAKKNIDRRREQIERFVERFRSKNTKASQVQSRIRMLEKMEDPDLPETSAAAPLIQPPTPPHSGSEMIRLEEVGHRYEQGSPMVLNQVSLRIERGDRAALVGYNGMGKTTLLRILAGYMDPSEGRRFLGHQVVVGYQSQEFAETIPPEQSVLELVRKAAGQGGDRDVRTLLGGFGFKGDAVDKPTKVLSGGEKMRLAFARMFVNPPNLLVLDEPTTHLDIRGREALEQALCSYTGAVCFVSHDVTFVRRVATSIFAMSKEGVLYCPGGYDYFLEKYGESHATQTQDATASLPTKKMERRDRASSRHERKERRKALEKQVRKLEKTISEHEEEQQALLDQIEGGTVEDHEISYRRLAEIQKALAQLHAEWEKQFGILEEEKASD